MADEQYSRLRRTLSAAADQAEFGKGAERHGNDNTFEDQQICQIPRWQKGIGGPVFQICKKAVEGERLWLEFKNEGGKERAIKELRGAINYAAAAIIVLEDLP